jgi:hypothetical protein
VGGDDLLAGRRRGKSAAEGIPSRGEVNSNLF